MARKDENPAAFLIPILTPLAWLLVGYPVIGWLWDQWWTGRTYAHGALAFLAGLYVGWRLWPRGVRWQGHDLGLVVLGLLVVGYILLSRQGVTVWAAWVWVLVGAAMVWSIAGSKALRRVWPAFFLFGLAVPVPLVERWGMVMGANIAALVVQVSRGLTVRNGSTLWGNGMPLTDVGAIAEWYLALMVTLAAALAVFLEGPKRARTALVVWAIPLALVATLVRVMLALGGLSMGLLAVARGLVASTLDFATLALVLGLLWEITRLTGCARVRSDVIFPSGRRPRQAGE